MWSRLTSSRTDMAHKRAKLNDNQEKFVHEYRKDRNAKQAAIRVGYSKRSAEVQGSRLLSNAKVAARIEELDRAYWKRQQMSGDEVLGRIARTARAELPRFFRDDGTLMDPHEWPEELRDVVAEFTVIEAGLTVETNDMREQVGGTHPDEDPEGPDDEGGPRKRTARFVPMYKKKIRLRDGLKALDMAARHHNLYSEEAKTAGAAAGRTVMEIIAAMHGKSAGVDEVLGGKR